MCSSDLRIVAELRVEVAVVHGEIEAVHGTGGQLEFDTDWVGSPGESYGSASAFLPQ